ncbi:hypothetical protein [Tenacibaculum ovolyticum]|uniref:hypothetical protein n=1 Tax=Tenacibaculum ovolyticum TaxID=104270 RepID=UPI003BAA4AA1
MKKIKLIVVLLVLLLTVKGFSQELSVIKSSSVSVNDFPEYVIITSQNTKLLGGIGLIIDSKKSKYKSQLQELEDLLQDGDKLRVRNQTDLLNAMSKLGFEYINAYNANAVMPSKDSSDLLNALDGGEGAYKVNMVFRKKEKFRN